MQQVTIQIQIILKNGTKQRIRQVIDSLANAVRVGIEQDNYLFQCRFLIGDSPDAPVFSREEIEMLDIEDAELEYVILEKNGTAAQGHNQMFENCETEYLLIVSPDAIVGPHFLTNMYEPFVKKEKIGLVEARQSPIENPKEYEEDTFETGWSCGDGMLIPTGVFREVKGLDAEYFGECCWDVDLSWRIRLLGYYLYYQQSAPVYLCQTLSKRESWEVSEEISYAAAKATLMMAYKWSNHQLVNRYLTEFAESNHVSHRKAGEDFKELMKAKALPEPLDKEQKVARFYADSGYAKHRYVL